MKSNRPFQIPKFSTYSKATRETFFFYLITKSLKLTIILSIQLSEKKKKITHHISIQNWEIKWPHQISIWTKLKNTIQTCLMKNAKKAKMTRTSASWSEMTQFANLSNTLVRPIIHWILLLKDQFLRRILFCSGLIPNWLNMLFFLFDSYFQIFAVKRKVQNNDIFLCNSQQQQQNDSFFWRRESWVNL